MPHPPFVRLTSRKPFALSLLSLLSLVLLGGCLSDGKEGEPDEPGARGLVRDADGKPVAGATMTAIPIDYMPKDGLLKVAAETLSVVSTRSGEDGRYLFKDIPAGEYNILGEHDGAVAFLDSIAFSASLDSIPTAVLRAPGSLSGSIRLEPNHDPRKAYVQVQGTRRFAVADTSGRFSLEDLAEGEYSLRVATSEEGYLPALLSVRVESGAAAAPPAIIPAYTGIPVVPRLTARYDSRTQITHLTWPAVPYRLLREYVVHRFPAGASDFPERVWYVRDTSLTDTLYTGFGFDFGGVQEYRVRVVSRTDSIGPAFATARVDAIPLSRAAFDFTLDPPGLTGGPGDSVRLVVSWSSQAREADSLEWSWEDGRTFRHVRIRGMSGKDTAIAVFPAAFGPLAIHVRLRDATGDFWRRTFHGQVELSRPTADAGRDTTVTPSDTVLLRGRGGVERGRITRYEWDIGNTGAFVTVASGDTAILSADSVGHRFHVLRVTDDADNLAVDTVRVTVRDDKPIVTLDWDPVLVEQGGGSRVYGKATDIGRIVRYEWDLGTGTFVAGAGPETVFPRGSAPGVRQVRLRVIDDDGNAGETSLSVPISTWEYLSDLPAVIRNATTKTASIGGKIYLLAESNSQTPFLNVFYSFEPATGTWTRLEPRPRAVRNQAMAASGGKILSFGGDPTNAVNAPKEVWEYEPRLDEWVRLAEMPYGECRWDCLAVPLEDTVYLLGSTLPKNVAFIPGTGAWKEAGPGPLTTSSRIPAVTGGTLFMATTFYTSMQFLAWRPGMTYWEELPDQPIEGSELSLVAAGGKVFLLGGSFDSARKVYRYDPLAKTWIEKTPMVWTTTTGRAVESGGKIYAIGDGKIQQYDPASEP